MSPTVTHNVIIADRSETGMIAIASILESCPMADEHVSLWLKSTGRFFLFVAEHDSKRFGAIQAESVDQLLATTLPELFAGYLSSHARSEFDIFVDDPITATIHDRVVQLQIAAALEAGAPSDFSPAPTPKTRKHRQHQQDTPADLTRGERERSIRYLCRIWNETQGARSPSMQGANYPNFEDWLRANGYSHYLRTILKGSRDADAEAWFNDELSRTTFAGR